MARKSKILDEKVKSTILKHIANGSPVKYACIAAGIGERTIYHWQERAEAYNPDNGAGEDIVYWQFFQDMKKAEAENIAANLANIQEASKRNNQWPASAWLLERKYPADFGKREVLQIQESKVLIALRERMASLRDVAKVQICDAPRADRKELASGGSDVIDGELVE